MTGQRTSRQMVEGVVVVEGRAVGAMIPVSLLVLDLVSWATEHAETYRRHSDDEDWTAEERQRYANQGRKIESWLETRETDTEIPSHVNMFLSARSVFTPHKVAATELPKYIQSVLAGAKTKPIGKIADPYFMLNVDKAEFCVLEAHGLRAVRAHGGPSVCMYVLSVCDLKATIANLVENGDKMKNVHVTYDVVTNEDGTESVVPPELICRAKPTMLRDADLVWVSSGTAKRVRQALSDAFLDAPIMEVDDAIKLCAEQGYEKVSTIYTSPDEGIIEHHVLCRNESGECVDFVITLMDSGGDGYYVDDINVQNFDLEHDTIILPLPSEADVALARNHGLLCQDDEGYHAQVRVFRSVAWQCTDNDEVDQDRLRQFWFRTVRDKP